MSDVRTQLADALRAAHYRINGSSADVRVDPGEVLADAALSLPGIAVVALPEPDLMGTFGQVWTNEDRYEGPIGTVQARPDGHVELRDDYERDYGPEAVKQDAAVVGCFPRGRTGEPR